MSSWIEDLFLKRATHIRPGIETVQKALKWWKPGKHKNILVAGTNGKGTVVANLWRILQSQTRVGIFTSPHLSCFSERFQINNQMIDIIDIENIWKDLKHCLPDDVYEDLSFFEVSVLIGMGLFKNHDCDIVVWEVGLGGRLDATNALDPDVSIVTSIDLDHQEWLGSQISDIAKEKLGIARCAKPLVWGEERKELRHVLEQEQERVDFELVAVSNNPKPQSVVGLPEHLQKGYDLAYTAAQLLNYKVCVEHFELALPAKFYRGRCEFFEKNGMMVWVDVCHNPAAAKMFSKYLQDKTEKIPVLYSVLDDKDEQGILEELQGSASVLLPFLTRSTRCNRIHYKASFADLWKSLQSQGVHKFAVCGSFQAATEVIEFLDQFE